MVGNPARRMGFAWARCMLPGGASAMFRGTQLDFGKRMFFILFEYIIHSMAWLRACILQSLFPSPFDFCGVF